MIYRTRRFLLACLAISLLACPTLAQDDCDWTATLHITAPIPLLTDPVDVAVAGGRGLVLTASELQIHDLADPANPAFQASLPLGGAGAVVTGEGDLAVVGVDHRTLLVGLADPSTPVILAEIELPAAVTALDLAGDRLAVGCGLGGIYLYDVSTPTAPIEGGAFSIGIGSEALDLTSEGDLLLAALLDRVAVIDVTDLAAPAELAAWSATLQHPATPDFLRVVPLGDHAAVVSEQTIVVGVDGIGEPIYARVNVLINLGLAPGGSLDLRGWARVDGLEVAAIGTTVYATGEDGMQIFEVAADAEPVELTLMPELADGGAIVVADDRMLVARPDQVDVLDAAHPGFLPALATFTGNDVAGQFVVSSDSWNDGGSWYSWSFSVKDLQVPGEPEVVLARSGGGTFDLRHYDFLDAWPGQAIVRGFNDYQGYRVATIYIDVRSGTPAVHFFEGGGMGITGALASGNRLYVVTEEEISVRETGETSETLPEIGYLAGGWGLPQPVVEGDHSLMATVHDGQFVLLDWSDPTSPVEVGACALDLPASLEAVTATRAYLHSPYDRLISVDIGDPSAPAVIWTEPIWPYADIQIQDELGLTSAEGGLRFVDLSPDTGPVPLGQPFGGSYSEFAWVDNLVYLNAEQVLHAWEVGEPTAPSYLGRATPVGHGVSAFGDQVASRGGACYQHCGVTAIDEPGDPELPPAPGFALRVAPNPFNPRTTVQFELGAAGPVRLALYDLAGRRIRVLVDERLEAGPHAAVWDGRDDRGRAQASGVYLARLETSRRVMSAKAVLVR